MSEYFNYQTFSLGMILGLIILLWQANQQVDFCQQRFDEIHDDDDRLRKLIYEEAERVLWSCGREQPICDSGPR